MKKLSIFVNLLLVLGSSFIVLAQPDSVRDIAKNRTAETERFGADIFTGEIYRGSFAADGKTFYFFKKVTPGKEDYRIFESQFINGKWSEPQKLNLGGEHSDLYPTISKNGKRLVFSSYRPVPNDESEKPNAHLWYVDKKDTGWSEPVFLSKVNKLGSYHSWVEFGWDGDIYFRQTTPDWKYTENLITRWNGKEYAEPLLFKEAVRWKNWNPDLNIKGVSPGPNRNILLLDIATKNPKTGRNASDIWFSLKKKGQWSEPNPFGKNINQDGFENFPFFSPDGKYMYFVRDFGGFYRIPLKMAIDSAGNAADDRIVKTRGENL